MIGVRVAERRLEDLEPGRCAWASAPGERRPQDPVAKVSLAVRHQLAVKRGGRPVRRNRLVLEHPGGARTARHQRAPGPVEAFAPYLLRPCLRSRDAGRVEVPRMMWYLTDGRS
jgi:hypothetical protein